MNLNESRDQQGNRASERARPPVLGAVVWEVHTRTQGQGHRSPSLGRQGVVLLSDEGVGAQEQENVAGVVIVVVRRGVVSPR